MPITGPWYISVAAVRELLEIKGLDRNDEGDDFTAAEQELQAIAQSVVDAKKEGTALESGAIRYRGPRPLRLRLTVMPAPRREGSLPQLVRVQPDHEGRPQGAYTVPNRVTPPKRVRDAERTKRDKGR